MKRDDVEIEIEGDRLLARASPSEDVSILVSAPAVPSEDVASALDGLARAINARAWSMSATASRARESALSRDLRRASERVRERESDRERYREREAASARQRETARDRGHPRPIPTDRMSPLSRASTDGGIEQ